MELKFERRQKSAIQPDNSLLKAKKMSYLNTNSNTELTIPHDDISSEAIQKQYVGIQNLLDARIATPEVLGKGPYHGEGKFISYSSIALGGAPKSSNRDRRKSERSDGVASP